MPPLTPAWSFSSTVTVMISVIGLALLWMLLITTTKTRSRGSCPLSELEIGVSTVPVLQAGGLTEMVRKMVVLLLSSCVTFSKSLSLSGPQEMSSGGNHSASFIQPWCWLNTSVPGPRSMCRKCFLLRHALISQTNVLGF